MMKVRWMLPLPSLASLDGLGRGRLMAASSSSDSLRMGSLKMIFFLGGSSALGSAAGASALGGALGALGASAAAEAALSVPALFAPLAGASLAAGAAF